MIVLKILLWIILAVLGIVLLILILPFRAEISYIGNKFTYKIKYWLLPLIDSEGGGIIAKFIKNDSEKSNNDSSDSEKTIEKPPTKTKKETSPDVSQEAEKTPEIKNIENKANGAENSDQAEIKVESESEAEAEVKPEADEKKEADNKKEKKSVMDNIEFALNMWDMAKRPVLKIFKGIKFRKLFIDFVVADEDAYKCALNYGRLSGGIYNILAWLSLLFSVKYKTVDITPAFGSDQSRWDISSEIRTNLMTLVISGIWFLLIYCFKVIIPKKLKRSK